MRSRCPWNSREATLLDNVTDFRVRFLGEQREWRDAWPDDETMAGQSQGTRPDAALPLGIEITIEHERFGEVVRTFTLPQFDLAAAQNEINAGSAALEDEEEGAAEEQGQPEGEQTGGAGG